MELRSNKKIELAREFILNTRANIFLTGKAGTGKTTFLRDVVQRLNKRSVIAAPTGVAALNAGGVTLHSLFQLPFGPYIPDMRLSSERPRKISKNRLALIRSIELLVIDEVSMVRADVMDSIDHTLRMVRRSTKPFAGVQLLMIGDVQQLSPICKDEEWELLREHYNTQYFFDSQALRKTSYISIEFDEIFRQSESHFTNILNAVRENRMTREILEELNRRYIPEFEPSDDEDYITLTTHNHTANLINSRKLAALKKPTHKFEAKVTGDFAESAHPNDSTLELKVGAQVLFIKNDISPQKRYYNGLLGRITQIDGKRVTVEPKSGGEAITVESALWESVDYQINKNGEMEQNVKGTFSQMPLKCAWAITIHKSQGLSFDRAIIDASGSFAHGQVYVALSRCRRLDGMVLRTPISAGSVVGDNMVNLFCRYVTDNQPSDEVLAGLKRDSYYMTLCEIFDYDTLQRVLWDLMSELSGVTARSYPKLMSSLMELLGTFEKDIVKVGMGFQRELQNSIYSDDDYLTSEFIAERLRRASKYFVPRFEALERIVKQLDAVNPDSVEAKRRIGDVTTRLNEQVGVVCYGLRLCGEGFSVETFQKERARLLSKEVAPPQKSVAARRETTGRKRKSREEMSYVMDEMEYQERTKTESQDPMGDIKHPELYQTLTAWRSEEARDMGKPAFCVLPNRTLLAIQDQLPKSEKALREVVGMGKIKMEKYSDQIIDIVKDYCFNN